MVKLNFSNPQSVESNFQKIFEASNIPKELIEEVREKLHKIDEVPKFLTVGLIFVYLRRSNGNVDETVRRIATYFKLLRENKALFMEMNPESEETMACFENQYYCTFPISPDNCNMFFMGLANNDPKNYVFEESVKTFSMMCDSYLIKNGPRNDTILIYDMAGYTFMHNFRTNIFVRRKILNFLENASILNVKKVHVFNASPFISSIFALLKKFSTTGLLQKIYLHKSNMNWDDFYKNHIPKTHLPSNYGGYLPSIQELNQQERKNVLALKEFHKYRAQQGKFLFDRFAEQSKGFLTFSDAIPFLKSVAKNELECVD